MSVSQHEELPKFSILICNYNYEDFIATAINSALEQEYDQSSFEVIVVDDGSTDNSRQVIESYAHIPNFKYLSISNSGQAAAFKKGLELATNDFICLLDSDDFYYPNKLARVAETIQGLEGGLANFFLCHDLAMLTSTPSGE